jgi:predicted nucleic acid-binding Zn ribbon protein
MQGMREVLRGSLARTLEGIRHEDRLAAAWTVACGRAMAEHGTVVAYENGVVRVEVSDPVWLRQMNALRSTLEREMARIAGVKVQAIEFYLKRSRR